MNHPKLSRYFAFGLVLFVAALVGICAASPSPNMRTYAWMPRYIAEWADANPTFRNFPAFAALAFLAVVAVGVRGKPLLSTTVLLVALAVSAFGTGLELLQIYLPGRFFDPHDIAWSITGAFAGSMAALPVLWVVRRLERHG